MRYRYVVASSSGFVQQVVLHVRNGYRWYVRGTIPKGRDLNKTDVKLLEQYGIDISDDARYRRQRAGLGNVHYMRHEREFVLMARPGSHGPTPGSHLFFAEERGRAVVTERPLKFKGYSVSYRYSTVTEKWHVSVRIDIERYRELREFFVGDAWRWPSGRLGLAFYELPFEPYAPVRQQLLCLLRAVNRRRRLAGMEVVDIKCLHLRRRSVPVFESGTPSNEGSAARGRATVV